MTKRSLLAAAAGGVSLLTASVMAERSEILTAYRKLKGRIRSEHRVEPAVPLRRAELPAGGEHTSIEAALNSRCCSDHDGDPDLFHWGMFDPSARLSPGHAERIARLAERCKLSSNGVRVEAAGGVLTFLTPGTAPSELSMIESGMQQQAACLACAALGVGVSFESLGLDGIEHRAGQRATVRLRLDAMKPSYRSSFWTNAPPKVERAWLAGNLPDPRRDGPTPLIAALEQFDGNAQSGGTASRHDLGQLLWAARGRTPHLYRSRPWGLTIPTWQGRQDITAVYLVTAGQAYRYVNWRWGRPSHWLECMGSSPAVCRDLEERFQPWNTFIVFGTRDPHARGLWEIGYQLLNVIIQARGLGLASQPILPREEQRMVLSAWSFEKPIAMAGLRTAAGPVVS